MSKSMKIVAATVVVATVAYFGSTYYVGHKLNQNITTITKTINEKMSQANLPMMVEITDVSSGFFSTTATLSLKSNENLIMRFDAKAKHGPFTDFLSLGLARIEATLTDDKGLQSLINYSKAPMNLVIDGTIGLGGGFNLALALSPIDKDVFTGNVSSDNFNALFVYEPNNSLNWQISTPKLSFSENIGSSQTTQVTNSLALDMLAVKGQFTFDKESLKPNAIVYSMSVDKGVVTNSIEPKLSADFNKFMISASMADNKENRLLVDAAYQLKFDDLKLGKIALDSILLDAQINKMSKESLLLDSKVGAEMAFIPLMLKQAVVMNNEDILNFEPTFALNALNMSNAGGKFTSSTQWELKTGQKSPQSLADITSFPVKSMNTQLVVDKTFITKLLSQSQQSNTAMSESDADKAADAMLTNIIDLSSLFGNALAVSETQLSIDAEIKNNKGTLNGEELKSEQIQVLLNEVLSLL